MFDINKVKAGDYFETNEGYIGEIVYVSRIFPCNIYISVPECYQDEWCFTQEELAKAWKKTNPSPMNGDYIYLSGLENAIWFKKRGGTFNAHCKSNVFEFPCGRSKLHPTEKNHALLQDLISDNSNEGDIVFDPCSGSASHLFESKKLNRRFLGIELDKTYFDIGVNRLKEE